MWMESSRGAGRAHRSTWTNIKMTETWFVTAQYILSYFLLFLTFAHSQGQSQGQVQWVSYALGPNTEVWTPNMPAVRTPRAGQPRRYHLPPPLPTLRPPVGPPQFAGTRHLPSNLPNNQNTPNRKVASLPPQPRAPSAFEQQKNSQRPVSQQAGHLHDSWPKTNTHHHLQNPPAPPNSKNWPTKIRLSNAELRMSGGPGQEGVDPKKTSITTDELSRSQLTASQKEKIIQMTNTLTKLSPKKPINVFMRYEGIAATRSGADVGQVIKKYAGSSKVPFFNGTLPTGSNLPSVFLAPEDTTPPYGYGKIPIPSLKPKKDEMPKMDEATMHVVQASAQVGDSGARFQNFQASGPQQSSNARADTFLGPASMSPPPGYTKILLPPGTSPLKGQGSGSGSITLDKNTKQLNSLSTDEKLRIIQALREGKTPQMNQVQNSQGSKYDTGYRIVQGPAFDPSSSDPLSMLKGMLPQGAIVESISTLGGGGGDTGMAGSIASPQVVKAPFAQQFPGQKTQNQQWPNAQAAQTKQIWPQQVQQNQQQWPQQNQQMQQNHPGQQNQPQRNQPQNTRQPNSIQPNFGNLNKPFQNFNQQRPDDKVVINPGIQISLPKVQDGGFNESELSKIIGTIIKQTEGPSSTTPMPFVQSQQWPPQFQNSANQQWSNAQNLANQNQNQRWPAKSIPNQPQHQNKQQGHPQWQQKSQQQQGQLQQGQNQQGQRPQVLMPTPLTSEYIQAQQQEIMRQKQTLVFPPGNKSPQNLYPPKHPQNFAPPAQTQQQQNNQRLPVLIPPPPASTPNPRLPPPHPTESQYKPQGMPPKNPTVDQQQKSRDLEEGSQFKQPRPSRPPLLQSALNFLGIQSSTGLPPIISGKIMGGGKRRPPTNQNQEHGSPANQERENSAYHSQERRPLANQNQDSRRPVNQNQDSRHSSNQNQDSRYSSNQNQHDRHATNQNQHDRHATNQNQDNSNLANQNQERRPFNQEPEDSDSSESTEVEVREKPTTTILVNPNRPQKGHGKGSKENRRPPSTIVISGDGGGNLGNLRRIITSLSENEDESGSEETLQKLPTPSQPPPFSRPFPSPSPGPFIPSPSPVPHFTTPSSAPWLQQNANRYPPIPHQSSVAPPLFFPSSTPRPSPFPIVSSPLPPFTLLNTHTPRPNTLYPSSTPFYPSSTPFTIISSTPNGLVNRPIQSLNLLTQNQGQLFSVSPTDLHANAVQNIVRQNLGLLPLANASPTSYLYNPTAGTLTPIQAVTHSPPTQTATYQLVTQRAQAPPTTTTTPPPTTTRETPTTTLRPRKTSSEETINSLQRETKKQNARNEHNREKAENDKERNEDKVIEKVRTEEKIIWNGSVPSKIRTQERTIIRPHQTAQSIRHEERVKYEGQADRKQSDGDDSLFKDFRNSEEEPSTTIPPAQSEKSKGSKGNKQSKNPPKSKVAGNNDEGQLEFQHGSNTHTEANNQKGSADPQGSGVQGSEKQSNVHAADENKRVTPPGTSFSELLTSKLRFEKMKEQMYPHQPIASVAPAMGNWPMYEPYPQHTFSSTPQPLPSTSTERATTPVDPNGRHRIRVGELTNSKSMTPITSITPSHFDPHFQHYLAGQQHLQEQYAYLMGTTPQPVPYSNVQGLVPMNYMFPYQSRGDALAENQPNPTAEVQPKVQSASASEKLVFLPSHGGASNAGQQEEKKDEQRLLFFPSSSPMPPMDFINPSSQRPQNAGVLDIGDDMQMIGETPVWEPFRNNAPSVSSTTTTTQAPTTQKTTTTTTPATTTTEKVTTTTQTPTTQKPTTSTEAPKAPREEERNKPSTWRPPHSHTSTPVTTTVSPPTPISVHERSKVASIGAGTLHAHMGSMTLQPQNNWEDTSHMQPKDIGASVLYAVTNGLPVPLQHAPMMVPIQQGGAHFQNHMLMQSDNSAVLQQQPLLVQYQMPYYNVPSPSGAPQLSYLSPSAQPHLISPSAQPQQFSPSAQPQFNSPSTQNDISPLAQSPYNSQSQHISPSAQPQYNSPSAQPYQNSPSAQPHLALLGPSVQPQFHFQSPSAGPQEYYNYQWEQQEQDTTAQPTTTPPPRRPDDDRPRYRNRFRIPPNVQAQDSDNDPQKLIPVYVHKNRRQRVRTTTTTTEAPPSDEYDDEPLGESGRNGHSEGPSRKQPNQYDDTTEEKMAPSQNSEYYVNRHIDDDQYSEPRKPEDSVRYYYDFSAPSTTPAAPQPHAEKDSSEETIYEVRVKTPQQTTTTRAPPKFTKFASGSEESNELDMNIYQNNYFQMARVTTSSTPPSTTLKPKRRKGSKRRTTTTTTTQAPDEESESESDESPEQPSSTTTQKPKRRRRPTPPGHSPDDSKRILPPFKASQTVTDYRKRKPHEEEEAYISPHEFSQRTHASPSDGAHYSVTRQESIVSTQGAVHAPRLTQNSPPENPQPQYRRHEAHAAPPSAPTTVEKDMFLLSSEDPNGARKQDFVSSEDKEPFRLGFNENGDALAAPTFKQAAMSLLNSNLVVKKTGPTMEFLSEDFSAPTQAPTSPATVATTTTTMATTVSTTTTQKPTTTTLKTKATTKKAPKSKISKQEKAKAEKSKQKAPKPKNTPKVEDYDDEDLKEILKKLQTKIQTGGGLSDYDDLGSAMLDYYDPQDLLETLKESPKKAVTNKPKTKKATTKKPTTKKSTTKKSTTKKTSTAPPVPKKVKNKIQATTELPKASVTKSPQTVAPPTVKVTTPPPTTTVGTTPPPPISSSEAPPPQPINAATYAQSAVASNEFLPPPAPLNPNSERRRIRVVRRRRPKPFPLVNASYPPNVATEQAPIVDTTMLPIQQSYHNTFSSRVGEIEGEPVRRRLKLVRKGNRAQWKLGAEGHLGNEEAQTLPLVSAPPAQEHQPERTVRMETSMTVETRVCVRGKCEVVTKN